MESFPHASDPVTRPPSSTSRPTASSSRPNIGCCPGLQSSCEWKRRPDGRQFEAAYCDVRLPGCSRPPCPIAEPSGSIASCRGSRTTLRAGIAFPARESVRLLGFGQTLPPTRCNRHVVSRVRPAIPGRRHAWMNGTRFGSGGRCLTKERGRCQNPYRCRGLRRTCLASAIVVRHSRKSSPPSHGSSIERGMAVRCEALLSWR